MSLFMSSGPSPEEIQQALAIKFFLTQQLKGSVHHLQEQHINSEDPIRSEEAANAVCSVLEAIFLHGLKASFSAKISNYLNGLNEDKDFSFWGFVSKFSHRDTVSHLNHLGQITTEVGMCRAWVRLALNDGLFESYLDAMLRDKKTLVTHYRRLAYLRDSEQPSILKSYLQGLVNFHFELSYNSSVLNLWTVTPLTLAGLVEMQTTPQAVIRPSHAVEALPNGVLPDRAPSQPRVAHVDHVSPEPSSSGHISSQDAGYSQTTIVENDIDDIRQMMEDTLQANKSDDDNSSTATSQVSQPDPVDVRQYPHTSVSPQQPQMGREFFGAWPDSGVGSDSSTKKINVKKKGRHKKKKKSVKITENGEVTVCSEKLYGGDNEIIGSQLTDDVFDSKETYNQSHPESNQRLIEENPTEDVDASDNCSCKSQADGKGSNSVADCCSAKCVENVMVKSDITKIGSEGNNTSQLNEMEGNVKDSVLPGCDSQNIEARSSEERLSQSFDFKEFNSLGKSEPLQPELSSVMAVASRVEEAEDASVADLCGNLSQDNDEEMTGTCTVRQQSNSLGHSLMQGWSSEFQEEEDEDDNSVYSPYSTTFENLPYLVTESRRRSENEGLVQVALTDSATDMLQTDSSPSKSVASKSTQELSESIYNEDYEVLPEATELSSQVEDMRQVIFKDQFGVLAVEKGLDVQNYQCNGCKRSVGMFFCQPRVCSYDGANYCYECHENEEYYVPAKIIHNWDFRKHLVCKENLHLLCLFEDAPLLNVQQMNTRLYDHVTEMAEAKELRRQLRYLKAYLFTCKQSVAEEFRRQVWPKEYLYDDIHSYSLLDLLQITNGQFAVALKKIIKFAAKHVYECRLCSQKGFICEICNNSKVIYPFQLELTKRCDTCEAVYHKTCKTEFVPCPKCQRLMERNIHLGSWPERTSTDYALAPAQVDHGEGTSQ